MTIFLTYSEWAPCIYIMKNARWASIIESSTFFLYYVDSYWHPIFYFDFLREKTFKLSCVNASVLRLNMHVMKSKTKDCKLLSKTTFSKVVAWLFASLWSFTRGKVIKGYNLVNYFLRSVNFEILQNLK